MVAGIFKILARHFDFIQTWLRLSSQRTNRGSVRLASLKTFVVDTGNSEDFNFYLLLILGSSYYDEVKIGLVFAPTRRAKENSIKLDSL
jgi:hypothetical protein